MHNIAFTECNILVLKSSRERKIIKKKQNTTTMHYLSYHRRGPLTWYNECTIFEHDEPNLVQRLHLFGCSPPQWLKYLLFIPMPLKILCLLFSSLTWRLPNFVEGSRTYLLHFISSYAWLVSSKFSICVSTQLKSYV